MMKDTETTMDKCFLSAGHISGELKASEWPGLKSRKSPFVYVRLHIRMTCIKRTPGQKGTRIGSSKPTNPIKYEGLEPHDDAPKAEQALVLSSIQ